MRATAPNLLTLGLGAALVAWGWHSSRGALPTGASPAPHSVLASEPTPGQATPAADYAADYADFAAALAAWRAGEDAALAPLRAAAERLTTAHGRLDARGVCEYFAGLSPEERAAGLSADERFGELWSAVQEAAPETWPSERSGYLAALREFTAEVAPRADFAPAGRALSLAARIELRALDAGMETLEREDTAELVRRDAREALAIFQRAGMETPQLEPLWLLARLDELEGREAAASEGFEAVLDVAELCRVDDYRERALLGLSRIAWARGDVVELDRLLAELASFRSPAESWPLALHHASQLLSQDLPDRAAEFLLRNRPSYEEDLEAWTQLLAAARLRQGDQSGARALLLRLEATSPTARLLRARLALAEEQPERALEELEELEAQPLTASRRRSLHELRGAAWLASGRPDQALTELREAGRLAESWEARLEAQGSLDETSATILGEWSGLHTAALEARALAENGEALAAAVAIERAQSRRWRGGSPGPAAEAELRAWAAGYRYGLVTWIFGADAGLAVHVDSAGSAHAMTVPHSRREITRAVRRLREALLAGDDRRAERLCDELAPALLPPSLLEQLESGAPQGRVLLLAHGAAELLPFEALRWEARSLDERATCLVLPELPARDPGQPAAAPMRWRLLGDPLSAEGWVLLPAAEPELQALAKLWPDARIETREDFTREGLARSLQGEDAVHVSTHLVDSAGCDSARYAAVGLLLSGGETLCAAELSELSVRSPLVVLSACETAGGRYLDARGRQGVARALLDAGARGLLETLWPVTDEAARRFTPLFHAGLQRGLSPASAAREARLELAAQGLGASDWAAFRLAGRD